MITPIYERNREFHTGGIPPVPTQECLEILIYYLANVVSMRIVGEKFGWTESTIFNIVNKMCDCLVEISDQIIRWPTEEEARIISNDFFQVGKISNVLGSIDGSHIRVKKLKNDDDFINRNNYPSILLQGVCDSNKKFIDIYCGEPGSMHDSRLLRKSPLFNVLNQNQSKLYNSFLLGDSAYASTSWIVPPFKSIRALSYAEVKFNVQHSRTRSGIENSFGFLKGRFRRLQVFENNNLKIIVKATVAACVLHNLCQDYDELVIEQFRDMVDTQGNDVDASNNDIRNSIARRDAVFQQWRIDANI